MPSPGKTTLCCQLAAMESVLAASNLAGRTVADLILERESELVDLPWVGPAFPRWEPEPLRWIGVSMVRQLGVSIDRAELAGRPTPRLQQAISDMFIARK